METYELIIMIALGLAVLLFGYRVKKVAFFIIWFLLGFNLTTYLLPMITEISPPVVSEPLWQTLLPIAGGLLLALLGFSIEKVCVGGICFVLIMLITINYFGTDMTTLAVGGVIAVIGAGLGVTLIKPATILATAVAGGYALTVAVLTLFPEISLGEYYWPLLIGISAIGAVFQFMTTKNIK
ncbi:DUF4203 domain-containing protein [Candidatus Saccharibacteria bacterium]|nr:DUF4203 domain-containing protein [Candidatus Saccharibacteria bacterium]